MAKRILFIAPDDSLAREVAAALPEVSPEMALACTERDALASLEHSRFDAVVAVDMPSRSSLGLCNGVRRTPAAAGIPVVVVCGAQLGDAVARHQKMPTRADAYLRAPADATPIAEALRALFGLSPPAEFTGSIVPDPPASVRPLRAAPPPPPPQALASKPSSRSTPAMPAVDPGARMATPPPGEALFAPSRKESGVMPAAALATSGRAGAGGDAEVTRLRREALDLAKRAAQAEARLAEADARAQSLAEALESATRQRAESDEQWTEWVTSAEKLADEAWRAREGLTRDKENLERELAGATARIAVLEGDLAAERERAKAGDGAARARAGVSASAGEADALANAEAEARVMAAEIAAAERLARACREIRATLAPTPAPADPDGARTTEWVRPDADGTADPTALLAREPGAEALPEVVAAVRRLKLERDQFARQATRLAEADATIRRLLSEQRQARAESARTVAELESKLAARNSVTPPDAATVDSLRARVTELERELAQARAAHDEVDDLQREVEFLTAEVNRLSMRTRQA